MCVHVEGEGAIIFDICTCVCVHVEGVGGVAGKGRVITDPEVVMRFNRTLPSVQINSLSWEILDDLIKFWINR